MSIRGRSILVRVTVTVTGCPSSFILSYPYTHTLPMSSARYEPLPSSSTAALAAAADSRLDIGDEEASIGRQRSPPPNRVAFAHDPRFDVPTPPVWQRAALVLFVGFLFWLGYKLRGNPAEEGIPAFMD